MKLKSIFTAFASIAVLCTCTPSSADNNKKPDDNKRPDDEEQITPKPEEKPEQSLPETIKILAIGNSFSADAVEQELYGLFEAEGQKVIIGNLYIGGCPLEKHAANAASDAAAYSYRKITNGTMTKTPDTKMSEALADEDWTFISVQEGAGHHGYYNTTYKTTTHTMEPALTNLIKAIRSKCKTRN